MWTDAQIQQTHKIVPLVIAHHCMIHTLYDGCFCFYHTWIITLDFDELFLFVPVCRDAAVSR